MSVKSKRVVIEHRKVALYCRVAREDETVIENQKQALIPLAKERGFDLGDINLYTDNGVNGLGFERGGFKQMDYDIQLGFISEVFVTSISRIGRNAIEVNEWIERVELKSVKVVSATEGVFYGNTLRDLHRELYDLYRKYNSKQRKNPHQHRVICTEK